MDSSKQIHSRRPYSKNQKPRVTHKCLIVQSITSQLHTHGLYTKGQEKQMKEVAKLIPTSHKNNSRKKKTCHTITLIVKFISFCKIVASKHICLKESLESQKHPTFDYNTYSILLHV